MSVVLLIVLGLFILDGQPTAFDRGPRIDVWCPQVVWLLAVLSLIGGILVLERGWPF